jgi:RNA polymerase sigma-70 factor (sigma-E family)
MQSNTSGEEFIDYVIAARPRLRRQAFLLCGDWHEADDLVQDTLTAAYRQWPRLVRRTEMDGYTHTILIRRFLSVRRQLRSRREIPHADPPEDQPGPWNTQSGRSDVTDLRMSLEAELRRLPPRQRAVIILRYWVDLSTAQVAAAMGISPGTVASQNHKALASLRGALSGLHAD